MYARRNSLTILGFLIFLVIVGYFWQRREASALVALEIKSKELSEQLKSAIEISGTLDEFKAEQTSLQSQWERAKKRIIHADEPAFSLSYINWLIKVNNLDIDFDFYQNQKKEGNGYTQFSYTLNGEGDYRNFCSLVWHLTRNPLLYQIRNVTIGRSDKESERLGFSMVLEGYVLSQNVEGDGQLTMESPSLDWASELRHDAFATLMPVVAPTPKLVERAVPKTPAKPQEPPGLLDSEKAALLAITNDKAYLRGKDGKVVALRAGDAVSRGRLVQLDQQSNQVVFQIEDERGPRTIRLNLNYD